MRGAWQDTKDCIIIVILPVLLLLGGILGIFILAGWAISGIDDGPAPEPTPIVIVVTVEVPVTVGQPLMVEPTPAPWPYWFVLPYAEPKG